MEYTREEILQFVEENDVKFIRLSFCDLLGEHKNVAIMAGTLKRALEQGVPFDAGAVMPSLLPQESELYLHPDLSTLSLLPWRPQQGRVARFFCDLKTPDGRPFQGDGRLALRRAVAQAAELGYTCEIGPECEFYLFRLDDAGDPTRIPHDRAGYLDIAPLDKGENVRREICLTLEAMGINPESSHHEAGPGQNEVVFR